MNFLNLLFSKNAQRKAPALEQSSNFERQVKVFHMSEWALDFLIGTKTNPEYSFEEQIVNKIVETNSGLSQEAISGIATTVATIDNRIIPAMQRENYILTLKGNNAHFESLQDKTLREAHLKLIVLCARMYSLSNIESISYSLHNGGFNAINRHIENS